MAFEVGERVIADVSGRRRRSQVGPMRRPRHGVIEEVLRGDPSPRYLIRWNVGEVSVHSPANGGLRYDPEHEPAA